MCLTLNKDVAGLRSAELLEVSQKPLIQLWALLLEYFKTNPLPKPAEIGRAHV